MTAVLLPRVAAVACLVALPLAGAPGAAAVTPPPIDSAALPEPAPPAPPRRTMQRGQCASGTRTVGSTAGTQLADLGLPDVWPLTRGAGQTIAVIDTGVARHRLLPRLVPGGDYVSTGDGTGDCDGHGTIVAGIIGAAPSSGFSGVAPEATIIGIRQSSNRFSAVDDPAGSGFGDVDTLAMAVRAAADMGATVINVSSVACVSAGDPLDDRALGAALSYAVDVKNVVVVSAAGNIGAPGQCPEQNPSRGRPDWSNLNAVVSPAWYDDYVLTVGSADADGAASRFSLAGPWVDVAAPGEGVVSLDPDGEGLVDALTTDSGETPLFGTSYAAPVVSGIAALIRSRSPELSARQVMQRIEATARHPAAGWDPTLGHGVVDALAAVTGGLPPSPADRREPLRPTVPPPPTDDRAGPVAIRGAAVCLGLTAALIAVTRLRRRPDRVARD